MYATHMYRPMHHLQIAVELVRRITNRARESLDVVFTSNTTAIVTQSSVPFSTSKCSLTNKSGAAPQKSIPGQCLNCQLYGHSSITAFSVHAALMAIIALLCAHATKKDGTPACVLCKSSSHITN
ncbi:hypothetical protein EVAR_91704_1 [Eumeta japonica]|uniref:Uncharacterized protein n=1 Tax=Eumeta variegata TaxID=151549 RepID=A0A4C2AAI8_EUMVA|nr:hypothetical protein EVAR_91704_1 [Eumeta japonica]